MTVSEFKIKSSPFDFLKKNNITITIILTIIIKIIDFDMRRNLTQNPSIIVKFELRPPGIRTDGEIVISLGYRFSRTMHTITPLSQI
jgi:hypothetical protein